MHRTIHVRLTMDEAAHLEAIAQSCLLPSSTVMRVLLRGAQPGDLVAPVPLRRRRMEVRPLGVIPDEGTGLDAYDGSLLK